MTDPILDLPLGVGAIAYDFRFDVVNSELVPIGEVHPVRAREGATQLQVATESEIKRTLRGFVLRPDEFRALNPYADRIRPWLQLSDGRTYSLGVLRYPQIDEELRKGGGDVSATLFDSTIQIRPVTDRVWSLNTGDSVADLLAEFAASRGITRVSIPPPTVGASGPVAFPIGTTGPQALNRLADLLGCYSPYFDRDDVLTVRPVEDLALTVPLRYPLDHATRFLRGSITRSQQIGEAPNVFLVVNTGATGGEIVGRYQVPASAPHSVENRGYEVPELIRLQGVEDTAAANRTAYARSVQSPADTGKFQFGSPFDPRHDVFDTIGIGDATYYEVGWTGDLSPGGTQTHNVRKVSR